MKQKFTVSMSDDHRRLIIREFAELDTDLFSPLCEEAYSFESIQAAAHDAELVQLIRTDTFFPTHACALKLASAIRSLLSGDARDDLELLHDDSEFLTRKAKAKADKAVDLDDDDDNSLDGIIGDDDTDEFDDEIAMGPSLGLDDDDVDLEDEI